MINRGNWKLTKKYMEYRRDVDQLSEDSLKLEKTYFHHLLVWADKKAFCSAQKFQPPLQTHLLSARLDGNEGQLSPTIIKKTLATGRRFFTWLRENHRGYHDLSPTWIKSLVAKRLAEPPIHRETVSIEEILVIAKAPVETIQERRIRAAAVFLYMSGIRIGAFVSLPIKAVDIESCTVKQHPSLGVRTKNNKHATTYLLPIPELLIILKDWDDEVKSIIPEDGYWFAHLSPKTGQLDPTPQVAGNHRSNLARRSLKTWMEKVGLPYKNLHAFRHGHVQWGLNHADDLADFKAISVNVMHSSINTTDTIYSDLNEQELQKKISSLSGNNGGSKLEPNQLAKIVKIVALELGKYK